MGSPEPRYRTPLLIRMTYGPEPLWHVQGPLRVAEVGEPRGIWSLVV